ncbi:TPA: hypothetical protein QCY03_003508 [Bacillus tropicus]|nr:hypothetical protein [Bacillus tropicus]
MSKKPQNPKTELYIGEDQHNNEKSLLISGELNNLHNDPQKIHELLDLLNLPKGTQVKVVTTATSVIVR